MAGGARVPSMPKLELEAPVGWTGAPDFRRNGLLEPNEWSPEDIAKNSSSKDKLGGYVAVAVCRESYLVAMINRVSAR